MRKPVIGCWECAHGPVQTGPIDKEVQSLRRRANAQLKQPPSWRRGSFVRSSASAQRFCRRGKPTSHCAWSRQSEKSVEQLGWKRSDR